MLLRRRALLPRRFRCSDAACPALQVGLPSIIFRYSPQVVPVGGLRVPSPCRSADQQPWGIFAKITGYEHVAASIDILTQFGGLSNREVEAIFPSISAEIDAVVIFVRRWDGSTRVRLSSGPRTWSALPGGATSVGSW